MLTFLFFALVFVIVLGILVLGHEFGHFWAARWNGIKVEEFGFGYPPRLFGIQLFRRNKLEKIGEKEEITVETGENSSGEMVEKITDKSSEIDVVVPEKKWRLVWGGKAIEKLEEENNGQDGTVYSINLLPFGGFCKIKGEEGGANDADSYDAKKPWQKVTVMAGGVVMNILLAAVLLSIGFMIGLPQNVENISDVSNIKDRKLEIMSVLPGKPAEMAGLKDGDVITKLGTLTNPRQKEMIAYVDAHKKEKISIVVMRGAEPLAKSIQPIIYPDTGKGGIGVAIAEVGTVQYPWYKAIYYGFITTFIYLKEILIAFYYLFKGLFSGAGVGDAVTGPVGIAVMTGRVARMGLVYLIQFTAVLSLNLAIVNALPLPALDGGKVLFLLIGKLRGRPVSQKVENSIHIIGFNLLILLAIIITIKDVGAFRGVFSNLFHKIF